MKQMHTTFPWIGMAVAALLILGGLTVSEVAAEPSEHHVFLHVVQPETGAPVRIIVSESDVLVPEPTPLPIEELPPVEDPVVETILEELAEEVPVADIEPEVEDAAEAEEEALAIVDEAEPEEEPAVAPRARAAIIPLPPEAVMIEPEALRTDRDEPPMGLLLFIFVLAIFLGFELISKVPSQLHTPLMSGSNAISGITIVGALAAAGLGVGGALGTLLGTLAVTFATINVVGGYMVTNRMLAMFKKKEGGAR